MYCWSIGELKQSYLAPGSGVRKSLSGGVDIAGLVMPFCQYVKLLAVILNLTLIMDRRVTEVVCICTCHTWAL